MRPRTAELHEGKYDQQPTPNQYPTHTFRTTSKLRTPSRCHQSARTQNITWGQEKPRDQQISRFCILILTERHQTGDHAALSNTFPVALRTTSTGGLLMHSVCRNDAGSSESLFQLGLRSKLLSGADIFSATRNMRIHVHWKHLRKIVGALHVLLRCFQLRSAVRMVSLSVFSKTIISSVLMYNVIHSKRSYSMFRKVLE